MQVGVAHVAHADLAVDRRNHHDVIGAVDAGIDHARREQGLDDHDEAAPVVSRGRHFEVEIGADDHLRERIVQLVSLLVVDVVDGKPDSVQIHGRHKVLEQGHNLHHLGGVGRHLGQVDRGFKLRRRGEIKSQRDVLRNILLGAGHAVLGNVEADLVALGAGILALGQRLVRSRRGPACEPARFPPGPRRSRRR